MELNTLGYLKNEYVYFPAILDEIGKNNNPLQPLFEAFTNALEAIRQLKGNPKDGEIKVKVFYEPELFEESKVMNAIVIEDTGIGFNDEEFQRFLTYKDNQKGYHNRGSGRLQYIQFFHTAEFESVFKDGEKFKTRKFMMSKNKKFLHERAIVYLEKYEDSTDTHSHTSLSLQNLIHTKDKLAYNLTLENYKEEIIRHYIQYFCANRQQLPKITLESYRGSELVEKLYIDDADIPAVDTNKDFTINFKGVVEGEFKQKETFENFLIQAFKIPKNKFPKNILKLTSKGEIVDEKDFQLNIIGLTPEDHIDNYRYLFLVSSPYIDKRDGDLRGQLNIPRRGKEADLFDEDIIFFDDIEQEAQAVILNLYPDIARKAEEMQARVSDLKEMFLIDENYLRGIGITDSEEKILEKVYVYESKKAAKKDAELKKQYDELLNLDPTSTDYDKSLNQIVTNLAKEIPHQNRAALTHYVARRRLVLEMFSKVLKRELQMQKQGRNEDEKLLHNLLFAQRTGTPIESDLWILSEDYILFKGVSESELRNVTIDGQKIFIENMTPEQEKFVNANREKRLSKRPDVLLFPAEEKCIILEFKTPNTNVADHLAEINYYASLILNLTKDEFPIKQFYGYLIGETLEPLDVRFNDSDFVNAAHFNFSFRPAKRIVGEFKNFDGTLYTEVLKYSTLLERAIARNKSFIDKLFEPEILDDEDELPF
ncbi:ATP-binding protein [Chitinophaga sp. sic0106]|uniref:ATP-binding protein n=1 Tax=Chitinophaga sp. sic0106 TaxID=2854785 RepID=UPI001C485A22|nr:ATP-binding protein [Chitinophaga sp. sic0106]MBV7532864.1 ATP-binding protein [Chitinophaga sp. sic0106]